MVDLDSMVRKKPDDPRFEPFIWQTLTIVIQRRNAASIMDTSVPAIARRELSDKKILKKTFEFGIKKICGVFFFHL